MKPSKAIVNKVVIAGTEREPTEKDYGRTLCYSTTKFNLENVLKCENCGYSVSG
jgi:hypothetical protein